MGCGGSTHIPRNGNNALTVYGDFFNSDTRTILSLLYIAGVPHQFQEVDTFKGDHKKEPYIAINPTSQIPLIQEGGFKVIGGSHITLQYLCSSHKRIGEKLYQPENK